MPNRYGAQMKMKRKKRSSGPGSLDQDTGTNVKKTSHIVMYDIRNGQRSLQSSAASSVMPNPTAKMRKSLPRTTKQTTSGAADPAAARPTRHRLGLGA